MTLLLAAASLVSLGVAGARPVIVGGVATSPVIETKLLSGEREGLPVWFLPRLGMQTRNDAQDLWLSYGPRSLRYTPQGGWQASGFTLTRPLSAPERYGEAGSGGGSLHVTLEVLRALGLALGGNAEHLNVAGGRRAVEVPDLARLPLSATAEVSAEPAPLATRPPLSRNAVPSGTTPRGAVKLTPPPSKPGAVKPLAPASEPAKVGSVKSAPVKAEAVRPEPLKPEPASITVNPVKASPVRAVAVKVSPVTGSPIKISPVRPSSTAAAVSQGSLNPAVSLTTTPKSTAQNNLAKTPAHPARSTPLAQLSPDPTVPAQPAPVEPTPTQPSTPQPSTTQPTPTQPPPTQPPPTPPPPIQPIPSGPRLTGVRSSLSRVRNVQLQRLVIDLSGPGSYSAVNERGGVTVFLPGAAAAAEVQTLESGDTLTLAPDARGVTVRLDANGGQSQVTVLDNPDRLVIDTATGLNADVPPPIKEDALPGGMALRTFGGLSLLSFDPARFAPHVVTAPVGSALSVAELVRRSGGVAGINGGYFDPPSSLPVDFVAANGLLLAASLERRGTVGFTESGEPLFGFPRPRYTLSGAFGSLNVNTISAHSNPNLLTAFVGDGHTAVGGPNLSTLTLNTAASSVLRADSGAVVPATGLISLSFDPARFPLLPRTPGSDLSATLNYQLQPWQGVREGLSAGPMLLQGGEIVLNPGREAFNVLSGVWRPTRQVAFAVYKGQPTLAFLEFGTPDTFARALHSAGVQDALRLDSGSSATVFVTGGYLGTGGYLNSVWSRPVPNAIVLVPVEGAQAARANRGK
ncbi:phosphodiester glycosidase family protein [Deinococcus sp.]|uniref:phosphodiester glycosidase family protein n=1 Tax=Deinococcus sp. TaxID=47478 RepID=UPI0025F661DC|nr:phosphodiester glycosidase family protein [Deinococcus sp.]